MRFKVCVAIVLGAVSLACLSLPAHAARHALVVGVGDYDQKKNGLAPLNAPVFDAQSIASVLRRPNMGFEVDTLTEVKDKAAFTAALEKFLARIRPGDEVVFYFSGHGVGLGEKGNHFLPLDAKDQDAFIREERKKPGSARELDTQDKENKRYEQYLTENALSENEIEKAIKAAGADIIILIADACRTQVSAAKGLVPVNSLRLPSEPTTGTFRLYAARRGQVSYDGPDNALNQTSKKAERRSKDEKDKDKKPVNSLFTGVFLSQISIPRQEINVLFSNVKLEVRDRARSLYGKEQVPDYDDSLTSRFYFWKGDDARDIAALCSTADAELDRLRRGVATGSVFAEDIELTRNKLAPCNNARKNYADEINNILRLHEQGGGGTLANSERGPSDLVVDPNNPLQRCDALASAPLDQSRPHGIRGVDLQSVAMEGRASDERRLPAVEKVTRAIEACETAVKERGRIARYKFNLGTAHYAMATLTDGPAGRAVSLAQASKHLQDAVDLGYPAAYNALALLHQHGEFYDPGSGKQMSPNRQKARELFQRGADLGHVLALYHLGLAYKNGGLGLNDDAEVSIQNRGTGKAFQYLSKAAESGFLPAMIETALALKGDWGGVDRNPKRAVELLEIAASRGSWEAMYQLGALYDEARDGTNDILKPVKDASDAIIWYARAAEAGDTRSQERLAEMLTDGEGLPAAQREAAGRYWRLAADGGSMRAQMRLANLLSDGRLPFRPTLQGKPDGGAEEILRLYTSAFANGNPTAGLELSRLYRSGFPKDRPSDLIPKDAELAVELLWSTMDRVRQARPTSIEADPMVEVRAAFELLAMQEAGEAKRSDKSDLINEDQLDQLRADYGDRSTLKFLNFTSAIQLAKLNVTITCKTAAFSRNIAFWSWKRSVSPTEPQFEWFERYYSCQESDPNAGKREGRSRDRDKDKADSTPEPQGLKRLREFYRKQYEAWVKDRDSAEKGKGKDETKERPQSFTDRIASLLSDDGGGSRRRR